ncbi:MAG TPA: hypothetical protein VNI57_04735 [Candidatus Saccharimonadales bacterium]|nr:hypothetical protein [Candidatus Saccharimonadales bacterium]
MRALPVVLVVSTLAVAGAAGPAFADIVVKQKNTFDGFGDRGWGANESESTLRLSGDRLEQESEGRMTGKIMRHLGHGGHTGSIVRLDKGVMWVLDYNHQTYTEMSLATIGQEGRDALQQMSQQPPEENAAQQQEKEKSDVQCDPAQVSGKNTGQSEEINGFSTQRFDVNGKQTCKNTKTNETCTISYDFSAWNTPIAGPIDEMQAFTTKQAKMMGFDLSQENIRAMAASPMFGGDATGLDAALGEMSKMKGYPIRIRFDIYAEGDCSSETNQPSESHSSDESPMSGAKKFFSKFKKKNSEDKGSSGGEHATKPGRMHLLGMGTEVQSISSEKIAPEVFDIPAGFTKKEMKTPS